MQLQGADEGETLEIEVERTGSRDPGAILLVYVTREITLQQRYWEEVVSVSPWIHVDRTERVWWRFAEGQTCADFLDKEIRLFVAQPCCDVLPSTSVPCVAVLDYATEVPEWAEAAIADKPTPK